MLYVVAYDIADDKRRKKLSDLLEGYGYRVQYSVYEIELSASKLERLLFEIERRELFDSDIDSIRIYHIHKTSVGNSFELCRRADPFQNEDLFV